MTISFFFLSETLTTILYKMSRDTGGSYQQTFCRNLSRADYCNLYNVAISFHRLHVLYDPNTHGRQQRLPAAEHRRDQHSRLSPEGVLSSLEDRMMASGDRGRTTRHVPVPPSYCKHDPAEQKFLSLWFLRRLCECPGSSEEPLLAFRAIQIRPMSGFLENLLSL